MTIIIFLKICTNDNYHIENYVLKIIIMIKDHILKIIIMIKDYILMIIVT